jgi:transposase
MMKNQTDIRWAGIDWGDQEHYLVVVDANGDPVLCRPIEHSAEGLEALVATLRDHGPIAAVAIERKRHLLIDKLLEANYRVYPINPKVAKTWREILKVDPPKSDAADAFSLAYNIRLHHPHCRLLRPDDSRTRQLRMLCEQERAEIDERTAKALQLKDCLKQYYPEALAWFKKFTTTTAADFIVAFPTPQALADASDEELRKFLYAHHIGLSPIWKGRLADRNGGTPWPHDEATVAAKSLRARSLAEQIKTQNAMLAQYRKRIETLFGEHPDAAIFASLPGVGAKLGPCLLTHFGSERTRYDDAAPLQALSGTVPVTKQSGKTHHPKFRWACQKPFRNAMFLFALGSIERSLWARAFYDRAKERGQSHPEALRNLGSKWIKIVHRMWRENTLYDEATYLKSLARHNRPLVDYIRTSEKCGELMGKLLT